MRAKPGRPQKARGAATESKLRFTYVHHIFYVYDGVTRGAYENPLSLWKYMYMHVDDVHVQVSVHVYTRIVCYHVLVHAIDLHSVWHVNQSV